MKDPWEKKPPSCNFVHVAATRWEVGFTEIVKFPCKNWTKKFVMKGDVPIH
jgi:hypothetical protein